MTKSISVVLVDDNVIAREAVAELIMQRPGFKVLVASAETSDVLTKVRDANADAVLLDARFKSHDSLRLIATLHDKRPDARVIITGIRPHQRDIACFVRAGVSGFIMKDASLDESLESIRVVSAGGHALPRRLTGSVFEELAKNPAKRAAPNADRSPALTNRERQLVALVGDGLGNKEIANRLNISVDTVRSHMANLFKKRGARRVSPRAS